MCVGVSMLECICCVEADDVHVYPHMCGLVCIALCYVMDHVCSEASTHIFSLKLPGNSLMLASSISKKRKRSSSTAGK